MFLSKKIYQSSFLSPANKKYQAYVFSLSSKNANIVFLVNSNLNQIVTLPFIGRGFSNIF